MSAKYRESEPPLITVIMPVYNAAKYLREAIDSILHQTYPHFEFLIFDDGSTDGSVDILHSYTDPRIQVFVDGQNLGQPKRYNAGIRAAKGKYIAIMHADDISLPHRFATQVKFLEEHEEYSLVGSRAKIIDEKGRFTGKKTLFFGDYDYIRAFLFFDCPIIHSSVMLSTKQLTKFLYDEKLTTAEDYELWSRMLFINKGIILNKVCGNYRVHSKNNHIVKSEYRLHIIQAIMSNYLKRCNIQFDYAQLQNNTYLCGVKVKYIDSKYIFHLEKWMNELWRQLKILNSIDTSSLEEVFKIIWLRANFFAMKNSPYISYSS